MWGDSDFYTVLGIEPSATDEEIKSAYRTLALRYHPDTSGGSHMTGLFRDVHQAYEVLIDPARREEYDRWRQNQITTVVRTPRVRVEATHSHESLGALQEPQMLYVILDISGTQETPPTLPLNLCLVLDRSTSMRGERLQNVKQATLEIIDHLDPLDVFSVVSFSDRAQVVISAHNDMDNLTRKSAINGIQAGGGTEIFQGLLAGMRQVNQRLSPNFANHVILLTDGQTYGDEQQCLHLADEAGRRNIGISVMGIGSDWNDRLLDDIAKRSGGSSSYLENPTEIDDVFRKKIRQIADTLAQQLHLTIHLADEVSLEAFRLTPELGRLVTTDGRFFMGLLESQTGQSVVLELLLPTMIPGRHRTAQVEVTALLPSRNDEQERILQDIFVDFVEGEPEEEQVPERIITAMGKVTIFRMQERALKDVESGRLAQATRTLERIATRLMDLGEVALARAASLEAQRLVKTGILSAQGQKQLKYGTRNLTSGDSDVRRK